MFLNILLAVEQLPDEKKQQLTVFYDNTIAFCDFIANNILKKKDIIGFFSSKDSFTTLKEMKQKYEILNKEKNALIIFMCEKIQNYFFCVAITSKSKELHKKTSSMISKKYGDDFIQEIQSIIKKLKDATNQSKEINIQSNSTHADRFVLIIGCFVFNEDYSCMKNTTIQEAYLSIIAILVELKNKTNKYKTDKEYFQLFNECLLKNILWNYIENIKNTFKTNNDQQLFFEEQKKYENPEILINDQAKSIKDLLQDIKIKIMDEKYEI